MASNVRYNNFIERTRAQNSSLQSYTDYLKRDSESRSKLRFEVQNDKFNDNKMEQKQRELLKQQKENFLDIRRKKLSDLLLQEDRNYHREIIESQDTPENQRRKMEKKLKELLLQKELDRQKIMKRMEDRRFYDQADELRKNDSQYFTYACHYEQENQMIDKLKQRQKEQMLEQAYDQLNTLDMQTKLDREKKEMEEIKEKNRKNVEYIEYQKQQQRDNLNKLNEINELEKRRLREQWKLDEEMEKRNALNRLLMNKKVNEDIEAFNKREEKVRNEKEKLEKELDKKMINDILKKEAALDEIDRQEKKRKIDEFYQNQKFLKYKTNLKKESELWMDKLAQEEADKQYRKEMEKWMKEEQARINLLKNVYADRARAVMEKKYIKEEEKINLINERNILDNEIKKYNEKVAQMKLEEKKRQIINQNELKWQIQKKEDDKKEEKQIELYERRMAQLWEEEYQNKINEQKRLHLQRLAEIKNKNSV